MINVCIVLVIVRILNAQESTVSTQPTTTGTTTITITIATTTPPPIPPVPKYATTTSEVTTTTVSTTTTSPYRQCGSNEVFTECFNLCTDAKCPTGLIIHLPICLCNPGCICKKGYLRNIRGVCIIATRCPPISTTTTTTTTTSSQQITTTTPINYIPTTTTNNPAQCGRNEVYTTCYNSCTEKKCPGVQPPGIFCPAICTIGCACKTGHVRNSRGVCVLRKQCPRVTTTTTPGPRRCGINEIHTRCYNACLEKKCPGLGPTNPICPLFCTRGCACKPGYLRNLNGECVIPNQCPRLDPPPPTTTTPGTAVSTTTTILPPLQCGVNEVYTLCYNLCNERKCPMRVDLPILCPLFCTRGCACKRGYVRKRNGICVRPSHCPKIFVPCTLLCRAGFACRIRRNRAECVRNDISIDFFKRQQTRYPTCKTSKCTTKGGCAMVRPPNCQSSKCEKPKCVEKNACQQNTCPPGNACILRQVECIRAPCDPIAECVCTSRISDETGIY